MTFKTSGQLAYEEDMRRCPFHHDGSPRRSWEALSDPVRWTWERSPSPRDWSNLPPDSPHLTGARR